MVDFVQNLAKVLSTQRKIIGAKNDFREWKCNVCGLIFSNRKKLQEHKHEMNHIKTSQDVLAENPICPFCGAEHKLQYSMTLHQFYETCYVRKDPFK